MNPGYIIGIIIAFWVAFAVYRDARNRYPKGFNAPILWALGVFSILILFLPLYFIFRPKQYYKDKWTKKCPQCSESIRLDALKCQYCGYEYEKEVVNQEILRTKAKEEGALLKTRKTFRTVLIVIASLAVVVFIISLGIFIVKESTILNPKKYWGGKGNIDGKFYELIAIAVDNNGYIWAADRENKTIKKFDTEGNFQMKITTPVNSLFKSYSGPTYIGFDKDNNLYALSEQGYWVGKYNYDGIQEELWTKVLSRGRNIRAFTVDRRNGDCLFLMDRSLIKCRNSVQLWEVDYQSSRFSPFDLNPSIATDMDGNIYISAFPGIKKFDENGNFIDETDVSKINYLACDFTNNLYIHSWDKILVFDTYLKLKKTYNIRIQLPFLSRGIPFAVYEAKDAISIYLAFGPHSGNQICRYVIKK